jgi:hypothetical protein
MPDPTPRQRLEGELQRSLPASITIRALPEGQADDGLLRLRLSAASETPLPRYDWSQDQAVNESLGMGADEVDLSRADAGLVTILANHSRYSSGTDTPLGSVGRAERMWVEGGRLMADVVISRRDSLAGLRQDIQDGIVVNVSIGAQILERVLLKSTPGALPEYRITRWSPHEISLVDVAQDINVGINRSIPTQTESPTQPQYRWVDIPAGTAGNTLERTMPEPVAPVAPAATPTPAAPPFKLIREAVTVAGFGPEVTLDMIERGLTIDQAREELFRKMADKAGEGIAPTRPGGGNYIETVRDETDVRRELMAGAILHRMDPKAKLDDGAREFRHMSLTRMAEESLIARNIRTRGLAPREIVERAMHSSSDFPLILANVANKRLRSAYEAAPTTYQLWARRAMNAPDFKTISVLQLGAAPDLVEVKENGEVTYGTIGEGREQYAVVSYARGLAFSRVMIVNDDLRAFDRIITAFSSAARRKENRLVYMQLTANTAMADGTALFHADHGNLAGTGAAISAATLGAGRTAMRLQKGLASEELNITPAYLIVPATQEQLAYQFTSTQYVPAKSTDVNEFRTGGRTALETVVEPYLDSASTTAWYLAGNGVAADTVEYCYLDGSEGVFIDSEIGFDTEGIKIKARLDFGAKAVDHRGLYKNAGG